MEKILWISEDCETIQSFPERVIKLTVDEDEPIP